MSEFNLITALIPDHLYKYIVMGLIFLLIFRQRIPILNKIDVTVKLPEEFMRHFRWLTPLLVVGIYLWGLAIYLELKALQRFIDRMDKNVAILQQQVSAIQQMVVTRNSARRGG